MLQVLKRKLEKREFLSSLLMILSGTILGQAIFFLSSFVITRIYTPDDFGTAGIYSALISFVLVVASLRYELVIPMVKDDKGALNALALSFLMVCFISICTMLTLFFLKDVLLQIPNFKTISNFFWLLPISIFFMGSYQVLNYWAIRKKFFSAISQTKVTQSIGQVLSYIIIGLKAYGPVGLIIGDIIGKAAGIRTLIKKGLKNSNISANISCGEMWRIMKRYKSFPLISTWSSIFNIAALQIPPIVMVFIYSQGIIGWFVLSQKVIMAPLGIIGQAVSQVYLGQLSKGIRENKSGLEKFFLNVVIKLSIIGLIPIVIILAIGPWIFEIGFGEKWVEAGVYSQYLAPMYLAYFVAFPLSQTLSVLELQKHQLAWDIFRFLGVLFIFYLAKTLVLEPKINLLYYGIFMAVSYAILLTLIYFKLKKLNTITKA
ncbi:lipopolysaccharide biosynthesis protein [Microbacteriaceae bacterium 4G12]